MLGVHKWPRPGSMRLPARGKQGRFRLERNQRRRCIQPLSRQCVKLESIWGNAKPQLLTSELAQDAVLLVTMGCGDKCPYVPGLEHDDWPLAAPAEKPMEPCPQN